METDGWETKAWGRVRHVFASDAAAISFLEVAAGTRSSWHLHADRQNVFHVGAGRIVVECRYPNGVVLDSRHELGSGDQLTVPAGVIHRFRVLESGNLVEIYWPRKAGVAVRQDDIERFDVGGVDDQHDQHKHEVMH